MAASVRFARRWSGAIACVMIAAVSCSAIALPGLRPPKRPVVVAYLTNSSLYAKTPFYVKNLVSSGSAAHIDQINYAAANVSGGHCTLGDRAADIDTVFAAENSINGIADDPNAPFRGYLHQLAELKKKYPRLKLMISLEGRAPDFAVDAQPENRQQFVRSCVDMYLRGHLAEGVDKPGLFDGVDIDWESPHQQDAANFLALVQEFRRQMNAVRPGMRLSVAVGASPHMLAGTDFKTIVPLVDQVGVMNYDYSGPWSSTTGLIAPLFTKEGDRDQEGTIERSLAAYRAAGVPASKLLMGVPFYGYGWTGVDAGNHGLFQAGRGVRGDRPYSFIRTLALPAQVFRDELSQAPWIFDGENFWTYEDPVSLRYKVSFAARHGLGGVMIWELSGDTPDGELLSTVYQALRHPMPGRTFNRRMEAARPAPASKSGGGAE